MPKFLHGIWTAVSASIDQSIPNKSKADGFAAA